MNRHHSSWLLGYLAAISLRDVAAERDADLTRIVFSLKATFSDQFQVRSISVSSNELTSWIECVEVWDSAGMLQDQFGKPFQRHVLNSYITYYMHAQF